MASDRWTSELRAARKRVHVVPRTERPEPVSWASLARVLGGDPPSAALPGRSVRIFVSSTFVDTIAERSILMEVVEPHIAALAKANGLEVVLTDMRWSVRNESTAEHQTVSVCLDQVDKCRRESSGPFFLFLGTSRVGYVPSPSVLSFEQMARTRRACAGAPKALALLDECYVLEENAVPPLFRHLTLLEQSGGLDFHTQSDLWWEKQQSLLQAVRDALLEAEAVDPALVRLWSASVTELEVFRAIEDRGAVGADDRFRRFAFLREFTNEEELSGTTPETGKGYVDQVGSARRRALWETICGDGHTRDPTFPAGHCFRYRVRYPTDRSDGITLASHEDYLWRLAADMAVCLEGAIEEELRVRERAMLLPRSVLQDPLGGEDGRSSGLWWSGSEVSESDKSAAFWVETLKAGINQAAADALSAFHFARGRASVVSGRSAERRALSRIVKGALPVTWPDGATVADGACPTIVVGEGGTGKSALMAATFLRARAVLDSSDDSSFVSSHLGGGGGTVIGRFCGTSSASCSARGLVGSIANHLACAVALRFGLLPMTTAGSDPRLVGGPLADAARIALAEWAVAVRRGNATMLCQAIEGLLRLSSAEHPTVILIDSVDQLVDESSGSEDLGGPGSEVLTELGWVPLHLPPHCRWIVSTLTDQPEGARPRCVLELTRRGVINAKERQALALGRVERRLQAEELVTDLLRSHGRIITAPQMRSLLDTCQFDGSVPLPTPLRLWLLAGIARSWSSLDAPLDPAQLPQSVQDAYRFAVAFVSHYHGRGLVTLLLALLSRLSFGEGMTERELLDSFTLDDELLGRVYQYSVPPTRRMPHLVLIRVLDALGSLVSQREGAGGASVWAFHHRILFEVALEDSTSAYIASAHDAGDAVLSPLSTARSLTEAADESDASVGLRALLLVATMLSGRAHEWFPSRNIAPQPDWYTSVGSSRRHRAAVPNGRKTALLPSLLIQAQWWGELADTLSRIDFLAAKVASGPNQAWEAASVVTHARHAAAAAACFKTPPLELPTSWQGVSTPRDGKGFDDPGAGGRLWHKVEDLMSTDPGEAARRLRPWERFLNEHAAVLSRRPWLFLQSCLNVARSSPVRKAALERLGPDWLSADMRLRCPPELQPSSMILALSPTPAPVCVGVAPPRFKDWVRSVVRLPDPGKFACLSASGQVVVFDVHPIRRDGGFEKPPPISRERAEEIAREIGLPLLPVDKEEGRTVAGPHLFQSDLDLWTCAQALGPLVLAGRGDGSVGIWNGKSRTFSRSIQVFPEAAGQGCRPPKAWTDHPMVGTTALWTEESGFIAGSGAGRISKWRLLEAEEEQEWAVRLPYARAVRGVCCVGSRVFAICDSGHLAVLNSDVGTIERVQPLSIPADGRALCVVGWEDVVVVGGDGGFLEALGATPMRFLGPTSSVLCLHTICEGAKRLLVGGMQSPEAVVMLWDALSGGGPLRTFRGHGYSVMSCVLVPSAVSEPFLVTGSGDGDCRVWELCGEVPEAASSGDPAEPYPVVHVVGPRGDGPCAGVIGCIRAVGDSTLLVAGPGAEVWRRVGSKFEFQRSLSDPSDSWGGSVYALLPIGDDCIAVLGWFAETRERLGAGGAPEGRLQLWQRRPDEVEWELVGVEWFDQGGLVGGSTFGRLLAVASTHSAIHLRRVSTDGSVDVVGDLICHRDVQIRDAQFDPTGRYIAAAGADGRISIWDWEEAREVRVIEQPAEGFVRSVAWGVLSLRSGQSSPRVAVGSGNPQAFRPGSGIWSSECEPLSASLSATEEDVLILIASTRTGNVVLWRWDEVGELKRQRCDAHEHIVWNVRCDPQGSTVASVSEDGSLVLTEVSSGREMGAFHPGEAMRAVEWTGRNSLVVGTTSGRLIPLALAE
jgi:WD40 repeat protein